MLASLSAAASAQSVPKWAEPGTGISADAPMNDVAPPCPPGQVDDGMGGCTGTPPPQVPIDGGLGLLAVAGGAYAARRLRRRKGEPDGEPDSDR